jgi:hypothetical protein
MIELVSILVVGISFYLHSRIAPMGLTRLNIISFTYYVHLILAGYVGSYFILKSDAYFNVVVGEVDPNTEFLVWGWLSYSLVMYSFFFFIGMLLVTKRRNLKRFVTKYLNTTLHFDNAKGSASDTVKLFLFGLGLIIFLLNLVFGSGFEHFKQFMTLDPNEIFRLRTAVSMGFDGSVILKNVGALFAPFICYYAYLLRNISKSHMICFYVTFVITVIYLFYDFAKSPVVAFLLGFLFLNIYSGKCIKLVFIVASCIFLICVFIGIYYLVSDNIGFSYLFSPYEGGLTGRILISQISSLYRHLELFPVVFPHIGFDSLSTYIGSDNQERSARLVLEHVLPGWVKNGYGDQLNTMYLGEAWANFGMVGLVLSPVWVGLLKGATIGYLMKLKKTPTTVAVLALLTIRTSINGGINDYIYNSVFWAFCAVIITVSLTVQSLKKPVKS